MWQAQSLVTSGRAPGEAHLAMVTPAAGLADPGLVLAAAAASEETGPVTAAAEAGVAT